jgi:hypothetical protein
VILFDIEGLDTGLRKRIATFKNGAQESGTTKKNRGRKGRFKKAATSAESEFRRD